MCPGRNEVGQGLEAAATCVFTPAPPQDMKYGPARSLGKLVPHRVVIGGAVILISAYGHLTLLLLDPDRISRQEQLLKLTHGRQEGGEESERKWGRRLQVTKLPYLDFGTSSEHD